MPGTSKEICQRISAPVVSHPAPCRPILYIFVGLLHILSDQTPTYRIYSRGEMAALHDSQWPVLQPQGTEGPSHTNCPYPLPLFPECLIGLFWGPCLSIGVFCSSIRKWTSGILAIETIVLGTDGRNLQSHCMETHSFVGCTAPQGYPLSRGIHSH